MITSNFKYLSKEESERLINSISFLRHKVIALLMLDAGLRVSEACTLVLSDFDFKKKLLKVKSLKKKNENSYRIIPISNRLYQAVAELIETFKKYESSTPLFSGCGGRKFISRQSVWKALQKYQLRANLPKFSPHSLRHSFATHHLANGTELAEIKTMLGHKKFDTTLIYAQVPTEQLIERVNSVTSVKLKWSQKLLRLFNFYTKNKLINIDFSNNALTLGRNTEIAHLSDNIAKSVNTIVLGDVGVGKTKLLETIETDKKILKLDDTESIKKSLVNILLYLFSNDRKAVLTLLWKNFEKEEIVKKIQRENTNSLCEKIIESTSKHEYVLLIDNISNITPVGKKIIEKFKDHFVIVCGARNVKIKDTSFLWNFEKFEIKPLNRHYSLLMINNLSIGMEIENWELYRNHIFTQTNGNPRAISELVSRYKKEPFVTNMVVREIKHIGALKEIDMTWLIVIFLGVVMATRYMAKELDEPGLKFIGSVAMIALLMMRPMMYSLKRKFL